MIARRILLVEDEAGLVLMLTDRLRSAGYVVEAATTGPEGLDRALSDPFDLILLDILLPGLDGLEICRSLRGAGVSTPILMLTALGDVVDKVVGLRTGADDYLTKPFATAELLARIAALLRRATHASYQGRSDRPESYGFGDVEVRFREAQVYKGGQALHFTHRMFELLRVFIERRGEALSRDQLLDQAWGEEVMPSARTVDVHVAWLRQRIEENPSVPRFVQTVRGVGYRFDG